jgi:hypothetical protein
VLKAFGSVHKLSLPVDLPYPFTLRNATREPKCRFPIAKHIIILAACLAVAMLTFLVLEAFDGDMDLGPFGADDFVLAPPGQSEGGSRPVWPLGALCAVQCFVATAGAHLDLRYRARSALAADPLRFLLLLIVRNVAESWEPPRTGVPGSRPFLC